MICPHCEKSIPKKISHPPVLADLEKQAAKAMAQLAESGLVDWLERRKCSQYRLAKLLSEAAGQPVSKTTVNSQITRGNIPPLMLAAIHGLVVSGKL